MSARRLTLMLFATLAVGALSPGMASASIGLIGVFGSSGPGAIGDNGLVVGGIAVDQSTGDVYVAEVEGNRVIEFSATGEFLLTFGREVNKTKVEAHASQSEQNICTAASGDTCQSGGAGSGPGEFVQPYSVAWDPSSGDIVVGENGAGIGVGRRIERFDAQGEYISEIESGVGATPKFRMLGYQTSLAVDNAGNLYVVDALDPAETRVLKLTPTGEYTGVEYSTRNAIRQSERIDGEAIGGIAVSPGGFVFVGALMETEQPHETAVIKFTPSGKISGYLMERPLGLSILKPAVDPYNENLLIAEPTSERKLTLFEYKPGGEELIESFAVDPTEANDVNFRGMAYGVKEGKLYLADAGYDSPGPIEVFGTFPAPVPQAPTVSLESTSRVRETSATLEGQINPNQFATTYSFQYATNEAFTEAVSAPVAPVGIDSGLLNAPVQTSVLGLRPSTLYYYRVVAHNSFGGAAGSTTDGATSSFATLAPPASATTGAAVSVSENSATVQGAVDPGSIGVRSDTRWCVEYGTASGAGAGGYNLGFLPELAGDAGQGMSAVPVSVQLTGLQPDTTYHYRVVAVNDVGGLEEGSSACDTAGNGQEADGADQVFTTAPIATPPVLSTGPAGEVAQNTATITGTVDPGGLPTSYQFQLGIDTSYGAQLYGGAGSGREAVAVSASLVGLQPGTTYHYRLVATNQGGTTYGADETFTTPTFPTATLAAPVAPTLVPTPLAAFPTSGTTTSVKAATKSKQKSKRKAEKKTKQKTKRKAKQASGARGGKSSAAHGHDGKRRSR